MWFQALSANDTMLPEWGVILSASLVGVCFDLRDRRIPNGLTLPLAASGLVWGAWTGGSPGLLDALGGSVLMALPYIVLFLTVGGGAGDAKLMGGLGAWAGCHDGLILLLTIAVTGAFMGIAHGAIQGKSPRVFANLLRMLRWLPWVMFGPGRLGEKSALWPRPSRMSPMPYGPAIFAGSCLAALGVYLWA